MRLRLLACAALFAAALPVVAATAGFPAHVDAVAPTGAVAVNYSYGTITLLFAEPMQTWDERRSVGALALSPATPCEWYWSDDTSLTCDAERHGYSPFREATTYRIDLGSGLYTQAGEPLAPTSMHFVVDPPGLDVVTTGWRDGLPLLAVESDQPLAPADIAAVLDVTVDGEPLAYTLVPDARSEHGDLAAGDTDAVSFRLVSSAWPEGPGELQVMLRDGLRSPLGEARGKAWKKPGTWSLHPPFTVALGRCVTESEWWRWAPGQPCPADAEVELRFTRPLAPDALALIAAALPPELALTDAPLACRWSCHAVVDEYPLQLKATGAERTLMLALPPGVRAADGTLLGDVPPIAIVLEPRSPDFRIEPPATVALPGSVVPGPLQARNTERGRWRELQVGARTRLADRRIAAPRERNEFLPLPRPPLARDLQESGGLAIGGIDTDTGSAAGATAVAAFQLLASEHGGEVLAWATTWAGAQPVVDADVELVEIDARGRETVRARGRSDRDGVVALVAPAELNPTVLRVLRATAAAGRVVVPLDQGGVLAQSATSRAADDESWWHAPDTPQFGVVERLLYRPGETVRYRLWPRTREGNRLVAAPGKEAKLELYGHYREQTQRTWTATTDAFGSVAGEVALPSTLSDDDYCIVLADEESRYREPIGACFRVGRFEDQPLFATLAANGPVLRAGERLRLAIGGGFYSGGAAAGAQLRIYPLVTPASFAEAYPAWRDYAFADTARDGEPENDPLLGATIPATLDAAGEATVEHVLPAEMRADEPGDDGEYVPMPFAKMQFNANVRVAGDTEAGSPTAEVYFAQYPRYVGLRSPSGWFGRDVDPRLQAVVVDHRGDAIADAAVHVRIETVPADGQAAEVLARCALRAGVEAACPFRAPREGVYAIVAEADDAAPVRMQRWFGEHFVPPEEDDGLEVEVLAAGDGSTPARLRIRQPFERAMVLLVAENGRVLAHWRHAIGRDATLSIPLRAEWAPGVSVRVLVRPAGTDAGAGIATRSLTEVVRVDVARAAGERVAMTLDRTTLAPGDTLSIRLDNPTAGARLVTLAIVDDSVHQQAADLHEFLDPEQGRFRGLLRRWQTAGWFDLLAWKHVLDPLFGVRRADAFARYDSVALGGDESESTELDTIQVTGSRIKRADIFDTRPAVPGPQGRAPGGPRGGRPQPRLRSVFPDSAYWNPGVVLAPGTATTLAVKLPDNLTRWRVIAWSSDAGDDFTTEQLTVTTALPVELRVGAPARLFVGDRGSAVVGARAAAGATTIRVDGTAQGAGTQARIDGTSAVAAQAVADRMLPLAPTEAGEIAIAARADSPRGADAVGTLVPVHDRHAVRTLVQAGWLPAPVRLTLPPLPAGATDAALAVAVGQGGGAWRTQWLAALRDYPHRCWEQTLSRGLGAALALADAAGREAWPEAATVADEAIAAAPGFRDPEGGYHYFTAPTWGGGYAEPPPMLQAWTLRAYGLLATLGTPVPERLRDPLRKAVAAWVRDQRKAAAATPRYRDEPLAVAAAALAADGEPVADERLLEAWSRWDDLSWYARSELVRALAAAPAQASVAAEGLARLREAGAPRGVRRVIGDGRDFGWAMGSSLRDQCAVVATLWDLDTDPAFATRREELLRGMQDLYAGGTDTLDTQASVHCLLALRAVAARAPSVAADVDVAVGSARTTLSAAADGTVAEWTTPAPAGELQITPDTAAATLNYVAALRFREDLRDAEPSAVGMRLERGYAVLRGARWQPVGAGAVKTGDWVRVTLRLQVPATRHFVAITDPVPGGWATRDVALSGVGGAALQAVADPGSWWFDHRRTGRLDVRLYATWLPAGTHEVHYFAQAIHAGEYFAPPATAELMYGRASRATTAPAAVRIAR